MSAHCCQTPDPIEQEILTIEEDPIDVANAFHASEEVAGEKALAFIRAGDTTGIKEFLMSLSAEDFANLQAHSIMLGMALTMVGAARSDR